MSTLHSLSLCTRDIVCIVYNAWWPLVSSGLLDLIFPLSQIAAIKLVCKMLKQTGWKINVLGERKITFSTIFDWESSSTHGLKGILFSDKTTLFSQVIAILKNRKHLDFLSEFPQFKNSPPQNWEDISPSSLQHHFNPIIVCCIMVLWWHFSFYLYFKG